VTKPASAVLVVDDDLAVGKVLCGILRQDGLEARHVSSGQQALAVLDQEPFEAVVADVRMPGMDGMQLLREIARRWPALPVLMLTAHGTVPLAVEAMKAGARTFLLKPFERDEILYEVRKALQSGERAAARAPEHDVATHALVGDSPAMQQLARTIERAAGSTATVLMLGESGTGKELVARAIHRLSARRDEPLVTVQCGALPDTLLEDELFGHERGAFTGAVARKLGRVELAHGGTLFLDEIGDVSLGAQVKLLRVLQERAFDRLGGTRTIAVDLRVLAATHRDLEAMCGRGEFREDLFYRLNVLPVRLPPLRERQGDVSQLAIHFCTHFAQQAGHPELGLEPEALAQLEQHSWPGNVRELQNLIERLVVLCDGPAIGATDVARALGAGARLAATPAADATLPDVALRAQCRRLQQALAQCQGNRTLAARLLGISRRTLYNKLEECKRLEPA
jgi:DNA-binding NtrC family response regulator